MRLLLPRHVLRIAAIAASATAAWTLIAAGAPSAARAATPLPACRYDDVASPDASYAGWATTLVDTIYRLPPGYEPPDLVPIARAGIDGGGFIREIVVDDLRDMLDAAARDGVHFRADSSYRSEATQAQVLAEAVHTSGEKDALSLVARPGHSEHELGTAIDFGPGDGAAPWDGGDWAKTHEGRWLAENGWRFGFVMSYPAGSSPSVTCYSYEPWHFRYFGREIAAAIHDSGLTAREFLWRRLDPDGTAAAPSTPVPHVGAMQTRQPQQREDSGVGRPSPARSAAGSYAPNGLSSAALAVVLTLALAVAVFWAIPRAIRPDGRRAAESSQGAPSTRGIRSSRYRPRRRA